MHVAAGDVDGDGRADIITGAGPGGGPHVRVFTGATGGQLATALGSFFAYGAGFTGGVWVGAGDVNGDGRADVITGAGAGGGPHVKAFSGLNGMELHSFFPYGLGFTGGVRVAAADVNGDGKDDIITGAGPGGGPHVRVFDGMTGQPIRGFFAYESFTGGIFVAGAPTPVSQQMTSQATSNQTMSQTDGRDRFFELLAADTDERDPLSALLDGELLDELL